MSLPYMAYMTAENAGKFQFEKAANDTVETSAVRIRKQLRELAEILRRMEFDDTLNLLQRSEMREALHAQTSMLEARLYSVAPSEQ